MERFKSFTLIILVITSIVLTFQIALNEKLWPNGYNFFVDSKISSISSFINKINPFNKTAPGENSNLNLTAPYRVIINTGGENRYYITNKSTQHDEIDYQINQILTSLFSSASKGTAANPEEVAAAIKTKSVYLDYINTYDSKLFSQFMNKTDTVVSQSISEFSSILVSFSDILKTNATVYIKDMQTNQYLKFDIPYLKTDFDEIFKNITQDQTSLISYSADLGYDKRVEGQKVLIESTVPIFLEPIELNEINSENPLVKANNEFDNNIIDKILRLFDINPNSVRKHTETDQTMVFVENNATLKIHKQGIVEYIATSQSPAIELVKPTASDSETMRAVSEFIESVSNAANVYHQLIPSPSSGDILLRGSDMNMSLDYIVNRAIVFDNYSIKPNLNINNSVYIQLEGGSITKYIHFLRRYTNTDSYISTGLVDKSLDAVFEQYRENADEIYITNIYPLYKYNPQTNSLEVQWEINVDK